MNVQLERPVIAGRTLKRGESQYQVQNKRLVAICSCCGVIVSRSFAGKSILDLENERKRFGDDCLTSLPEYRIGL